MCKELLEALPPTWWLLEGGDIENASPSGLASLLPT